MNRILVVGAGFSGAALSRTLAESGLNVHVIDKRSHLGGNAFDYINSNGERIHKYGPHLFHGSAESTAVTWLSRFTDWIPYEHKVRALLDSGYKTTPLPVNRSTLEDVFNISLNTDSEAKSFLASITEQCAINSADDVFRSSVGKHLSDLFFRPYTRKMWGIDAREIEASVGKRLPVRTSRDDRYFTDNFQALPKDGYAKCFQRIFDHPCITVELNREFKYDDIDDFDFSFLCLPIDSFFNYCFGKLPYRSIKFEHRVQRMNLPSPVVNFTDEGIHTRMTQWDLLPNSPAGLAGHTITYEIPCSPEDNENEIYYPVRNSDSLDVYKKYCEKSSSLSNIQFCGRTGLFEYLDMVPAITKHLSLASNFLKNCT